MKLICNTKPETVDLPFEVGETYFTKIIADDKFTVDRIDKDEKTGLVRMLHGRYEKSPHLLNCGLPPERLIARKQETGKVLTICLCPHCKGEITS